MKKGNKVLDDATGRPDIKDEIKAHIADINMISNILGIFMMKPAQYFAAKKEKGIQEAKISSEEIEALIQQRADARKNKDFARADEIREQLASMNIILEDGPQGTTWRID